MQIDLSEKRPRVWCLLLTGYQSWNLTYSKAEALIMKPIYVPSNSLPLSYNFSNTEHRIFLNHDKRHYRAVPVLNDVPQGSILGAMLFLLYMHI